MEINIKIDSREPKTIQTAFKRAINKIKEETKYKNVEFNIVVEALPVGDCLIEDKGIVIERKEYGDYIESYKNKHLHKQLIQQKQFSYSILIIVGSHSKFMQGQMEAMKFGGRYIDWKIKHHHGSIASLKENFDIVPLIVDNNTQYADMCLRYAYRLNSGEKLDIKDTELLKNSLTTDDIKLRLLTCFNGVGLKKAEKILIERPEISTKLTEIMAFFP